MRFDEIEIQMRAVHESVRLQNRIQQIADARDRGLPDADSRIQGAAKSLYRG